MNLKGIEKITKTIALILFLSIGNKSLSQTIEGYKFKKYKSSTISSKEKTKINYSSYPTSRQYRTRIAEGYKYGTVNFAGHYITISWGCGTGCMSGMMVDIQDGKVYDLPMNETTFYYGCYLSDDVDYVMYNSKSRLFVTIMCSETELNFEKTYFINVWDEVKKKFVLLKKIKRSVRK
jgi:hypothetical protein